MPRLKHLIVDGFLPLDLHRSLLEFALANEAGFAPSEVRQGSSGHVDADWRKSLVFGGNPGDLDDRFRQAIDQRFDEFLAAIGTPPFEVSHFEIELAAHGDGCFFKPHIDTITDRGREGTKSDRLVSGVYYFHRQPRAFSGGELAIHPLGPGEPELIEAIDNRLVLFPSIALHQVHLVICPGDEFANSRFSINCWLRRARVQ